MHRVGVLLFGVLTVALRFGVLAVRGGLVVLLCRLAVLSVSNQV